MSGDSGHRDPARIKFDEEQGVQIVAVTSTQDPDRRPLWVVTSQGFVATPSYMKLIGFGAPS